MKRDLPLAGSPSRIETSARCNRRGFMDTIVEVRPKGQPEPASLAFGTCLHAGVGAHWKREFGYADLNPYVVMDAAWDEALASFVDDKKGHTRELGQHMLRYYMDNAKPAGGHWAAGMDGWHPLMVDGMPMIETRMETKTPGGFRLRWMLDRLMQLEDRDIYTIVDLKSAAYNKRTKTPQFYNDWDAQWQTSLQMKLYKWAARQTLGIDPDVQVEGMLKHMETQYFPVGTGEWTDSELDEAVGLFDKIQAENQDLLEKGLVNLVGFEPAIVADIGLTQTKFNYMDCNTYYTKCAFYDICRHPPEQRLGMLLAGFDFYEGDW